MDELSTEETTTSLNQHHFTYTGKGWELTLLMYKNLALTLLTLGIYSAWARTNNRRYLWGNVHFMGDRGNYTGTAMELFRGWILLIGIYLFVAILFSTISAFAPGPLKVVITFLLVPFYAYIYALIIYGGTRFKLSRTSWRDISFGMEKNKLSTQIFILLFMKGTFLTALTLGCYFPIHQNEMRKFLTQKMFFGSSNFEYTATNGEYYRFFAKNILFCLITLGFYIPWMYLNLIKFKCEHTIYNKNVSFKLNVNGIDYFLLSLVNLIIVMFSFGLLVPWMINRNYKFFVQAIELNGSIDFNSILRRDAEGNAIMDAASVDYDIDLGF